MQPASSVYAVRNLQGCGSSMKKEQKKNPLRSRALFKRLSSRRPRDKARAWDNSHKRIGPHMPIKASTPNSSHFITLHYTALQWHFDIPTWPDSEVRPLWVELHGKSIGELERIRADDISRPTKKSGSFFSSPNLHSYRLRPGFSAPGLRQVPPNNPIGWCSGIQRRGVCIGSATSPVLEWGASCSAGWRAATNLYIHDVSACMLILSEGKKEKKFRHTSKPQGLSHAHEESGCRMKWSSFVCCRVTP